MNRRTLCSRKESIGCRINLFSEGRDNFHHAMPIGAGDDQSMAGGDQQVQTGFAVTVSCNRVKEAGPLDVGDAYQSTKNFVVLAKNGRADGQAGRLRGSARQRTADRACAFPEGRGDGVILCEEGGRSFGRKSTVSKQPARGVDDQDATIEQRMEIDAPIDKILGLGRALRNRLGGQNIAQEQCAGPRFDLFVDLRGDERDSRQLLVAKHVLHVVTQHATGEIR